MYDCAILNGRLLTETDLFAADIGLQDGKIATVAEPGQLHPAKQTIDASDLLILPGVIDIHWHARTPAYPERGDFYTETRAAAAGGVTTVFEMPISKPGCATPETFANRQRLADEQCVIDFALFGAPGTLKRDDVLKMGEMGAIAFKIFMHRAPIGRDDEFIGICLTNDDDLHQALMLTKETGRRLVVHAEADDMLYARIDRMRAAGRTDRAAHGESRPPVVEAVAIARLLTLAEDVGAPVHVAHVSSAQALRVVQRFQRDGLDITAETCPHYLFFDEEDFLRLGPFGKINPPIRSKGDQAALWQGLADGSLHAVTTDHSPYVVAEKERGLKEIWLSPSGAPGVQALLPIMMTAALQGKISLHEVVKLLCGNPSRLFDVAPQKGAIQVGADADIVLYDPRAETTLSFEKMVSKARGVDKLYLDYPMRGEVVRTMLRGETVFVDGEVVGKKGNGRFVRPHGA